MVEPNYVPLIVSILTMGVLLITIIGFIAKAYHRIEEVVKENAELKARVAVLEKDGTATNLEVKGLKTDHGYVLTTLAEIKSEVSRVYELLLGKR